MGHHGTLVRVEARWGSRSPEVGTTLHLMAVKTCAHPVPCVVEASTGTTADLRAWAPPDLVFERGVVVDLIVGASLVGTGKVI